MVINAKENGLIEVEGFREIRFFDRVTKQDMDNLVSEYIEYVFEGGEDALYIYHPSRSKFGQWKCIMKYFSDLDVDAVGDDTLFDLYLSTEWYIVFDMHSNVRAIIEAASQMEAEEQYLKDVLLSVNRQEVMALAAKIESWTAVYDEFSQQMKGVDMSDLAKNIQGAAKNAKNQGQALELVASAVKQKIMSEK